MDLPSVKPTNNSSDNLAHKVSNKTNKRRVPYKLLKRHSERYFFSSSYQSFNSKFQRNKTEQNRKVKCEKNLSAKIINEASVRLLLNRTKLLTDLKNCNKNVHSFIPVLKHQKTQLQSEKNNKNSMDLYVSNTSVEYPNIHLADPERLSSSLPNFLSSKIESIDNDHIDKDSENIKKSYNTLNDVILPEAEAIVNSIQINDKLTSSKDTNNPCEELNPLSKNHTNSQPGIVSSTQSILNSVESLKTEVIQNKTQLESIEVEKLCELVENYGTVNVDYQFIINNFENYQDFPIFDDFCNFEEGLELSSHKILRELAADQSLKFFKGESFISKSTIDSEKKGQKSETSKSLNGDDSQKPSTCSLKKQTFSKIETPCIQFQPSFKLSNRTKSKRTDETVSQKVENFLHTSLIDKFQPKYSLIDEKIATYLEPYCYFFEHDGFPFVPKFESPETEDDWKVYTDHTLEPVSKDLAEGIAPGTYLMSGEYCDVYTKPLNTSDTAIRLTTT